MHGVVSSCCMQPRSYLFVIILVVRAKGDRRAAHDGATKHRVDKSLLQLEEKMTEHTKLLVTVILQELQLKLVIGDVLLVSTFIAFNLLNV